MIDLPLFIAGLLILLLVGGTIGLVIGVVLIVMSVGHFGYGRYGAGRRL